MRFDFCQIIFNYQNNFMKRFAYPFVFILIISALSFRKFNAVQKDISGAWRVEQNGVDNIIIYQDGYFSQTVFDKANKSFTGTTGGVYKIKDNLIETKIEFNSKYKNDIGEVYTHSFDLRGDELVISMKGHTVKMKRIDDGNSDLAGVWRITGRMQNGEMVQMQRGDRKTIKLLSASRFQWMAINPASKEFFGTGGGTYIFKNGKYTETIEFFSRDSSRVGASLTFDGVVKDGSWNHKGLSSKGDPIDEVWTKEKNN